MRRFLFISAIAAAFGIAALLCYSSFAYQDAFYFLRGEITIEKIICEGDLDNDGISNMDDLVQGARKEVLNRTRYQSTYYKGGYPYSISAINSLPAQKCWNYV